MHRCIFLIACGFLAVLPNLGWAAKAAPSAKAAAPAASTPADSSKAMVVNGIAAEVSGRPITLEEVLIHRGLDKVKSGQSDLLAVEKGEALHAAVQKMLLEEMVFGEMKSLNFDGGPKTEATKVLADRRKVASFRGEWEKFLAHFSLGEEKAVALLWRSIQVDKFIEKKVETLTPLLTSDVVDRHLIANNPGWEGMPEDRRRELRQRAERLLKKERMGQQLQEWVLRLKRKYSVVQYI
jgi:hypothetical protein